MNTYNNCVFHIHNFYSNGEVEEEITKQETTIPPELNTEQAWQLWKIAIDKGWVEKDLQLAPNMTIEKAAIVAERISYKLELKNRWKAFEKHWNINYLQSKHDRAMSNENLREFYDSVSKALK